MNEPKYCNHCPRRSHCIYFKKNSFCEVDQIINEDVSGFRNAYNDKWYFLTNLSRTEEKNHAKFYDYVNKEAQELFQEMIEMKKEEEGDDEDAGFQKS